MRLARSAVALLGGAVVLTMVAVGSGTHDGSLSPLIGRLHSALVHLPIGLLLASLAMDLLATRDVSSGTHEMRQPTRSLTYASGLLRLWGAWSAVLAAIAGLLLADWGSYAPDTLQRHRWLGVLTAYGAVAWSVARDGLTRPVAMSVAGVRAGAIGMLALVSAAGHLGGTLVQGDGYLTRYLPDGIRRAAGMAAAESLTIRHIANAERTPVFDSIVQPVLMQRCASCHNPSRTLGGLDVTSAKSLLAGGRQGKVIAPGRADDSEIIIRLELPPGHLDAMPPDDHLPASEIALLRWWIDQGASTERSLAEIARPTAMRRTLAAYGLEEVPAGVFALTLPPLDTAALAAARKTGLTVQHVGDEVSLLSVDAASTPSTWSAGALAAVAPLAAHITELSLTRTQSNDSALTDISRMTHLTRLHLAYTRITDAGVSHVRGLEHLEYVNLVGTSVSDAAIDALSALPKLRAVYLWGTRVTPEGAARLRRALPRATVVLESASLVSSDTTRAGKADRMKKARS